jgi:hypothetical protein
MKPIFSFFLMFDLVFFLFIGEAVSCEREGQPLTEADKAFFMKLKTVIERKDKEWLATHISFPITVRLGLARKPIKTREEFIINYDAIINSKVKLAVEKQEVNALFKNWRGLMVGDGEIWFTPVQLTSKNLPEIRYFITGINN